MKLIIVSLKTVEAKPLVKTLWVCDGDRVQSVEHEHGRVLLVATLLIPYGFRPRFNWFIMKYDPLNLMNQLNLN